MANLARLHALFADSRAHRLLGQLQPLVLELEVIRQELETEPPGGRPRADLAQRLARLGVSLARFPAQVSQALALPGLSPEEPVSLDLHTFVDGVHATARQRAVARGVRIERLCPDKRARVRAREHRLRQAVLNLVANALEAMPEGGELGLGFTASAKEALLFVEDEGAGVDPERVEELFEDRRSTRRGAAGTGLGVARRIARAHGGELELSRRPGGGTRAQLRLPLETPDGS